MTKPILEALDSLPKASDVYLWCDFIELRCLVHPDKRFSRQDFIEVVDDTRSAGVAVAVANDSSYSDDDESGVELNGDGAASEDGVDEQQSLPASDKSEALAADLYGNLMVRKAVFADAYPFELSSSGQEIRLSTSLTPPQILYLELLLSSSLRFIPKTRRKELTDPFESLSTKIFSALMPNGWEVHQFGAQTGTRYRGHLATRMDALAKDWRGKHLIPHSDYRTHNAGDGGLDIVAWHPMGDEREGVPIAAAQCGCTATEWQLKQLEASPALLGGKLWALHPWATYYFMPQDLLKSRNGSSEWQRRNLLGQSIVVDRLRIVRLARQYGIDAGFIAPSNAVTEARSMAVA